MFLCCVSFSIKGEEYPVDSLDLGKCTSLWNPRTQMLSTPSTCSISLPRKAFTEDGKSVKTHILSIQVTIPISKKNEKKVPRNKTGFDEATMSDKEGKTVFYEAFFVGNFSEI